MKIHTVEPDLFHVDGWTDRLTQERELLVTFHKFSKAPKNSKFCPASFIVWFL